MLARSNWFATPLAPREVLGGVTRLGSERVSFYALCEGRSITLVDCGFYGHLRYLEAWLASAGRRMSDVEAVVITHGHADHLGFAALLSARGVPVLVPEGDLAVARTVAVRMPPARLRRRLWRPSCLALFAEAAMDSVFAQPAVERAIGYAADATLDVPGRLRSVFAPGHSKGNSSLFDPARGALFSGDTLMTRDPMGTAIGPTVFAEDPARDAAALAALTLLEPYAEHALLPAHGEPWTQRGAVAAAIRGARLAAGG